MKKAAISLVVLLLLFGAAICQQRYDSGPFKGFLIEEPELNKIEFPPLRVASVSGIVVYGADDSPLSGAAFEIRNKSGRVFSAFSDVKGRFSIPNVPPGHYDFKVTHDQFFSVVGKIEVVRKCSRNCAIRIQLKLGT